MKTLLALTLVLAADGGVVDGGVGGPFSGDIYKGCPVTTELAEVQRWEDGGTAWLLPPARAARQACLLASCDEDYQLRRQGRPIEPPAGVVMLVVGGVATATALAFGAGYLAGRLAR